MEGLPLVCYSSGTMSSLLDKLTKLKNNHSNPSDEFSVLTEKLKEDLLGLKEFCDKLGTSKVCMKQLRELVFEIEDWIDQRPETNILLDTEEIKYFMSEIKGARERFKWYRSLLKIESSETDLAVVAPSKITIDPRLLSEEKYCHGILDGPRDELVKHLTDQTEEMLKVVSVVGVEGLGKTTLAKEIYSKLQLRRLFECQAMVSLGRRPAMRDVLYHILHQVNRFSKTLHRVADVQEIITELREYLGGKRYFIIVDDIRSTFDWKVINSALPYNRGSRVLTTTCNADVGKSCSIYPTDLVYHMDVLSEKNSKIFLLNRIITLQEEERGAEFEEVSGNMLNLCGGMPLAIIVAASLLVRKSKELAELKIFGESIYSTLRQYSTSKGMTMILHKSYADLSLPLRSCFLYLGVFPEGYIIKKDRLIRLWEAEGFISRTNKEYLWVTGETYFNELISRRLIEPLFGFEDDQASGCIIHGVILDFIRSLWKEENFATTAVEMSSGPFPCDTIRRFSVDYGNKDEANTFSRSTVHLSSMRSLTVFGDVEGMFDPLFPSDSEDNEQTEVAPVYILWSFKLLRVLDLEDRKELKGHQLKGIGGLVLLRYLGLAGTHISWLPEEIGELEQLETLDLRRNWYFGTLPKSIFKLQKLKHVLLNVNVQKSFMMQELEEANIMVNESNSLGTVAELLRKSEWLRMLRVTLGISSYAIETNLVSFFDAVVKSKLHSLSLNCEFSNDEMVSLLVDSCAKLTAPSVNKSEPPRFELVLFYLPLRRVPPDMDSLSSLTHLHIQLEQAKAGDFHVLGGLSNLVLFNLYARKYLLQGRLVINKGIFPCLKVFSFIIQDSWTGLEFKEGAMPQLQRLWRTLGIIKAGDQFEYPDIGMEHLTCLTRVHVEVSCAYVTYLQVEAAEAVIRAQISEPTLVLSRFNGTLMKGEEQHSLEDEYPMWKGKGQHSQGQMWKGKGEQYSSIPSERQLLERMRKNSLQ
ncbi:unnamed protein product [Triticum turgidum subsp. durum]|uniref:NB-ARC domain-containing protein n=1 Tax=Triticum turgidum subsp. durum TaxID=4567 RepID=A0A9R0R551_TRITD|nr:unnamed protein product [Triticum turgidum subsp. durum]